MSKRKADSEMETAAQKSNPADSIQIVGDITINKSEPLEDYQKLINTRVAVDQIVDDAITKENFRKIAAAARDVIWQIIFGEESEAASESQKKASDLLEEYKGDACFYEPWPYNEWIVKLRDELLKKQQLHFWRDTIVKKQLGPCWSRDSDLFDSDDEPPLEFYAHAGCVAPFAASVKVRAADKAEKAESGNEDPGVAIARTNSNEAALTGNFEAIISLDTPLADYRDLMKRYVLTTCIVPDDIQQKNIDKIQKATRSIIWKLLFEGSPTQSEFDKAAELLQEYKGDAGFYGPWEYNEWIVKLRDEVLQREMLDFWGQKMVEMELGPCCARDSDYFDNMDEIPVEFYNKAGYKAPFDPPKDE